MRYSIRTFNYLKKIVLSNLTHMMSMVDLLANNVETLRIDIEYFWEKLFIELIYMNFFNGIILNS